MLLDRFHTTYCTNIHPGENWDETFRSLKRYAVRVKEHVAPTTPFGIGLRLSNRASEELGAAEKLTEFRDWLDENQLYVFTMNGFPYGSFHGGVVKDSVHAPDWTTSDRVSYTKRLIDQLAYLLPGGVTSGGISTSPISYKRWYSNPAERERARACGVANIVEVLAHLVGVEARTGKYVHLDIEPEPDGLLENSTEVVALFKDHLLPVAVPILQGTFAVSRGEAQDLVYRHINICYDVCHFALAYEDPAETFRIFKNAKIKVGKVQVSSALKAAFHGEHTAATRDALAAFDESTYLHQVTEQRGGGVFTYRDLPDFFATARSAREARVHFHVPIFMESYGVLSSTQSTILEVIEQLKREPLTSHLEVETYTWDVLPEGAKLDLTRSITRELNWLKANLNP